MHTFPAKSVTFHHNSDLSGDVWLDVKSEVEVHENGVKTVKVAGKDILAFVADYVRNQRIAALEQADTDTLLLGR